MTAVDRTAQRQDFLRSGVLRLRLLGLAWLVASLSMWALLSGIAVLVWTRDPLVPTYTVPVCTILLLLSLVIAAPGVLLDVGATWPAESYTDDPADEQRDGR